MRTETTALSMSEDEIKRRHREGASVEILAELNACAPIVIKQILNPTETQLPRHKWRELYDQGLTAYEILNEVNISASSIYKWMKDNNLKPNARKNPKQHKTIIKPQVPKPEQKPIEAKPKPTLPPLLTDPVDHPPHYNQGEIECIDAIRAALGEDGFRSFCKGNALKYIWRADHKQDATEDIRKAIWYLNRSIGGEA